MTTTTNTTRSDLMARYEAARKRIDEGGKAGLSERTMNRRWNEFFKVEDELKAYDGRGCW